MNEVLSSQQRQLAESAVPMVRRMARVLARGSVSKDDLEGVGMEAAVRAALHFRPELGVPFLAYATKTIRGRMLDAACALRAGERGKAVLAAWRAGSPTGSEDDDGALALCDVVATQLGAQVVELLGVGPAPSRTPEDLLVSAEARARATLALRRALESLEPRERAFVHGYYFDGGTLDELAPRLDLPVIAVRRMRKKVETVLWKRLKAQGVDEAPASSANS
jgi:RNA polymerase sigma factor (sigma-70 family)